MPSEEVEPRGNFFGPAPCPVCGSIGARALMLDHIEEEHPGGLVPLAQHQRAIADTIELDSLRRCQEDRTSLKQDLRDLQARYDQLSEQTGSAIVRAHLARGDTELREAKTYERAGELEETLRQAVRIVARGENEGARSREGQDFLYSARKVLRESR